MPSRSDPAASLHARSRRELEAIVETCERALLRGTSSHADLGLLIAAERELLRREAVRTRSSGGSHPSTSGTPRSRSGSLASDDGALSI